VSCGSGLLCLLLVLLLLAPPAADHHIVLGEDGAVLCWTADAAESGLVSRLPHRVLLHHSEQRQHAALTAVLAPQHPRCAAMLLGGSESKCQPAVVCMVVCIAHSVRFRLLSQLERCADGAHPSAECRRFIHHSASGLLALLPSFVHPCMRWGRLWGARSNQILHATGTTTHV
jgi:hypothetical protein